MGCASSSPLVAANGKMMETAKGAASDAMHAGEEVLGDVKSTVTETVSNVKEAVVEAVQNVGHGIESAFNTKKDTGNNGDHDIKDVGVINATSNDDPKSKISMAPKMSSGALDKLSDTINSKSKEYQDEAEKLTDDLIKETNDVVGDTIDTTNKQVSKSINHVVNSAAKIALNGSPAHSLNSLETNSPEPEIEKAMANEHKNPPTPKPTYSELEKLQSEISSSIINSGRSIIEVATAKFDTAVPKVGASNGQVLVTAE